MTSDVNLTVHFFFKIFYGNSCFKAKFHLLQFIVKVPLRRRFSLFPSTSCAIQIYLLTFLPTFNCWIF